MRRSSTLVLVAAALGLALAGCSSSSSGGTPTANASNTPPASPTATGTAPANPAAAKAEIKRNWEKFFASSTTPAIAATLLEDGSSLGPALTKAKQEDQQTGGNRSAKVTKITFTTPTQATVNYKLHVGTTNLNATGISVDQGGTWKVSKTTFCTLVELGNNQKPVKSC